MRDRLVRHLELEAERQVDGLEIRQKRGEVFFVERSE